MSFGNQDSGVPFEDKMALINYIKLFNQESSANPISSSGNINTASPGVRYSLKVLCELRKETPERWITAAHQYVRMKVTDPEKYESMGYEQFNQRLIGWGNTYCKDCPYNLSGTGAGCSGTIEFPITMKMESFIAAFLQLYVTKYGRESIPFFKGHLSYPARIEKYRHPNITASTGVLMFERDRPIAVEYHTFSRGYFLVDWAWDAIFFPENGLHKEMEMVGETYTRDAISILGQFSRMALPFLYEVMKDAATETNEQFRDFYNFFTLASWADQGGYPFSRDWEMNLGFVGIRRMVQANADRIAQTQSQEPLGGTKFSGRRCKKCGEVEYRENAKRCMFCHASLKNAERVN
ncbi:MAG: hypothetical protein ACFFCS_22570 [Candidatus Hodarchaeota archaeon]